MVSDVLCGTYMGVLAQLAPIASIGFLLSELAYIYSFIIIAAAIVSWLPVSPFHPIVKFLRSATEPVLRPLRRLIPPERTGNLDISPVIALFLIQLAIRLLQG